MGEASLAPCIVPTVRAVHQSRYLEIDGIRTHYIEAGEGPVLVLLHSGEFGACAELSWEYLIPALSEYFRVIAPDWLGFGRTAKIHDFESKRARMLRHLARFCEVMAIDAAPFVGNSMGATYLLQAAAEDPCPLPVTSLVAISGGGFIPENEERQRMVDYDGSTKGMIGLLTAMFDSPVWFTDPDYVARRHALSIAPGAWESIAAARFRSPVAPPRSEFGNADTTAYNRIAVPSLLIAGGRDRLRLPGYADKVAAQIRDGRAVVIPDCGHCPNIERPAAVAAEIIDFVQASDPGGLTR